MDNSNDLSNENYLKLLAEISLLLTEHTDLNDALNLTLQKIGSAFRVNRVYIFEDSEDRTITNNTFEWCAEGTTPQKDNLQNFHYDTITPWREVLASKGKIIASDIKDLDPNIYKTLSPQQIKAIIVLPLKENNDLFGFIGFDDTEKNRLWSEIEIYVLETVASLISHIFVNHKLENRLKGSIDNLERMNQFMVDREMKIIELKDRLNQDLEEKPNPIKTDSENQ